MDALVSKCLNCGEPLKEPRKFKKFCSYACRGQQKAIEAVTDRTGLIRSKSAFENKELRRVKMQSVGAVTFAKVNSCIYRVGTRNKRAAGWLMEVAWPGGSRQRWVARVGDRASEPLSLDAAKQAAIEFLRERGRAEPRDFIAELNQIAANEVDGAVLAQERKRWPVNIMGGGAAPRGAIDSAMRKAMLSTEVFSDGKFSAGAIPPQGDCYPLEYYEEGESELPACLDRRKCEREVNE